MPQAALVDENIANVVSLFRQCLHHRRTGLKRKIIFAGSPSAKNTDYHPCHSAKYITLRKYQVSGIKYQIDTFCFDSCLVLATCYLKLIRFRRFLCHSTANLCASLLASRMLRSYASVTDRKSTRLNSSHSQISF